MGKRLRMIMVSAWHEQFGNGMLRHLDGHPQLFAYPFESQMATPLSSNMIAGPNHWVPQRYAYPEFSSSVNPEEAYHMMWDQELKTYLRTPHLSKFKDCGILMDEKIRIRKFINACEEQPDLPARAKYVYAFFQSTFDSWTNYSPSGHEDCYVGYIPPIIFDAEKFFKDFPHGHMIHIIRNPYSGYADTIKRPFPFSLTKYCQIWNAAQLHALVYKNKYAGRFHIVYAEDLFDDKESVMGNLCARLGIRWHDSVLHPSFAGKKMESVYPWGTIKHGTTEANINTMNELTLEQKQQIFVECQPMLAAHKYSGDDSPFIT